MTPPDPLLVVAATPAEVGPLIEALSDVRPLGNDGSPARTGRIHGTHLAVRILGIGKANTAAGLARILATAPPAAVVQIGIGGTYAGSFLPVGGVALADAEFDLDFGVRTERGWRGAEALGFGPTGSRGGNRIPTDATLTRWLSEGSGAPAVAFGTSDSVSGDLATADARRASFDVSIESMEGAAAAQTALAFGVPFAEVRGVSNVAGQRDKALWDVRGALRAATAALIAALRSSR